MKGPITVSISERYVWFAGYTYAREITQSSCVNSFSSTLVQEIFDRHGATVPGAVITYRRDVIMKRETEEKRKRWGILKF